MRRLVLAGLVTVAACGSPLGTNDVALDFTGGASPIELEARLHAVRLEADVTRLDATTVRVVLDADGADLATAMITWHGGLVVATQDKHEIVDLGDAPVEVDGKEVVVALPAAVAARLRAEPADEVVRLRFASSTYWMGPLRSCLREREIVFAPVTDITGYKRARDLARLLRTPRLPALTLRAREALPTDWPLAIGSIALPLVVALGWLFFIRRFDRARPEPWWLVAATCALGGASQVFAAMAERWLWHASPYLDHRVMSLDHGASAFPLSLLMCMLVVGVVEEGAKLLAAWSLAMHRREFDEPVDGIVFAAAAGIGFATAENILYFTHQRFGDGLAAGRSIEAVSGHMMYAAI